MITERWVRLLVTSLWTYSEKIWQFRNKVVHGQTENFRVSKDLHTLQEKIRQLYHQFEEDPFMLPDSRRHLFYRPLKDILTLDKETLEAWCRSVTEGMLTQDHREALAAQELKRTLHGFFNQKMDKKDMSVAETASWRTAPFSAAYYKRVNQSLRKKGRKTFSQQPSRLKQPARRRLHYKWKRTMAGNKTLWECGFVRKETPIDRRSHAPMGEKEFSGTRVSTAP